MHATQQSVEIGKGAPCCWLEKGWQSKEILLNFSHLQFRSPVLVSAKMLSIGCCQCQEISSSEEWPISPLLAGGNGLFHRSLSTATDSRCGCYLPAKSQNLVITITHRCLELQLQGRWEQESSEGLDKAWELQVLWAMRPGKGEGWREG